MGVMPFFADAIFSTAAFLQFAQSEFQILPNSPQLRNSETTGRGVGSSCGRRA